MPTTDSLADALAAPYRTIIEPFKIKVVEPIPTTTLAEREAALAEADWNLFRVPSSQVTIDLLTDSGTGAMSQAQWAAMMTGDESYAGSRSFEELADVVRTRLGFERVFPVHQGRAAERLLFAAMGLGPGCATLSNGHFDTTRAHVEGTGATAVDLSDGRERAFAGNIDLERLEASLTAADPPIGAVVMTLTNNAFGGHPVSLANLHATAALCRAHRVPLVLDAARFAENAMLIKQRDPAHAHRPVTEIVRELFDAVDAFTLSAKKDALVNIGGLLGVRDPALATAIEPLLIRDEGYLTYGGLAGRDLAAMAVGLREVTDEAYLTYRLRTVGYLAEGLSALGLPVVRPTGGHAVYLDAGLLLPELSADRYPAQTLACAFYRAGGVRPVALGPLAVGDPGVPEYVRLTVPRRVYTQSHFDYLIEVGERVAMLAPQLEGLELTEAPAVLKHFLARFRPAE